jgi:hypothetical protein
MTITITAIVTESVIIEFYFIFSYVFTQQAKGQLQSEHGKKKEKTHRHKQKTKQGNLCHSDNSNNSLSAIMPTIIRSEKIHTHTHIQYIHIYKSVLYVFTSLLDNQ